MCSIWADMFFIVYIYFVYEDFRGGSTGDRMICGSISNIL